MSIPITYITYITSDAWIHGNKATEETARFSDIVFI